MTQPKINFIHKNNCPVSISQRGNWAASIPAECNCETKEKHSPQYTPDCYNHTEEHPEIFGEENWEKELIPLFIQRFSWITTDDVEFVKSFIRSLLSSPETHKDCISRAECNEKIAGIIKIKEREAKDFISREKVEKLLKRGHGGGNWRRLIMELLSKE